jgi:hypothetical protein
MRGAAELAASDFHSFSAVRVQSGCSDLGKAICNFAHSRHHITLGLLDSSLDSTSSKSLSAAQ